MTSPLKTADLPKVSDDGSTVSWNTPFFKCTFQQNTVGALLLTGIITGSISWTKGSHAETSDAVTYLQNDRSMLFSNTLEVDTDDRENSTVMLVGNLRVESTDFKGLALDVRFAVRDPFTSEELERSRRFGNFDLVRHPVRQAIIGAQVRGKASLTLTEHSCLLSAIMSGFLVVPRLEEPPGDLLCGLSDAILNDKDSPPTIQAYLESPEYTWELNSDGDESEPGEGVLDGTQVNPAIKQEVPVEVTVRLVDLIAEGLED